MYRSSCGHLARLLALAVGAMLAVGCQSESRDAQPAERLNPLTLTAPDAAAGLRLLDRDTGTAVPVTGRLAVEATYGQDVELRAVKLFTASSGALHVELDGESLALTRTEGGWATAQLERPVRGKRFSLSLSAESGPLDVGALELWGSGPKGAAGVRQLAEASTEGRELQLVNAVAVAGTPAEATLTPVGLEDARDCVGLQFDVPKERVVTARRAFLAYEAQGVQRPYVLRRSLNGGAPVGGLWLGAGTATRTLTDELDPAALTGEDRIFLCLPKEATAPVQLSHPRLLLVLDDGLHPLSRESEVRVAATLDDDTNTGVDLADGALALRFDRTRSLDGADLLVAAKPSPVRLAHGGAERVVEVSEGWNHVALAGAPAEGVSLGSAAEGGRNSLGELRLQGSVVGDRPLNDLVVSAPAVRFENGRWVGERFGDKALVGGWATSARGEPVVELDGVVVSSVGGAFSQVLRREPGKEGEWTATLTVRFGDGTSLARTIHFLDDRDAEVLADGAGDDTTLDAAADELRFGREERTQWGGFDPAAGGRVELGSDVHITAPAGAVDLKTPIGITRKMPRALPPLDPGMVNVTAPRDGAYRFSPPGQQFKVPVEVVLPYDASRIPEGLTGNDVQTYFYDNKAKRWTTLRRREVRLATRQVVSETTHFTFMINAVLATPEHTGPATFNPTALKDLKTADPSVGIDLIEPPRPNGQGSARTAFPIRLPPARGAFQPGLQLAYDSSTPAGWLGVGWDLPVSNVQIDTKFGAPRYDGEDIYALDGEQLVPAGEERCVGGGEGRRYYARVERDFRRIIRCGKDVASYHFEVTDKSGTLFVYGASPESRLAAPGTGEIGRWDLERVVDSNGNLTLYTYEEDSRDALDSEPAVGHAADFRQHYLSRIHYTGFVNRTGAQALAPIDPTRHDFAFTVELHSTRRAGVRTNRPDPLVNGRLGFKVVTRRLLGSIVVRQNVGRERGIVRAYALDYQSGDFGKSVLTNISTYGRGNLTDAGPFFYAHDLEYTSGAAPVSNDVASAFSLVQPMPLQGGSDLRPLHASTSSALHAQVYAGVGFGSGRESGSVGLAFGLSGRVSGNHAMLADLNGDALPDRLTSEGVLFNHGRVAGYLANLPPGDPFSGTPASPIGNQVGLGLEVSGAYDVGLSATLYPVGANFSGGMSVGAALDGLMDADGDGLVDYVNASGIKFQQEARTASCGARFCFSPEKQLTTRPEGRSGFEGDGDLTKRSDAVAGRVPPTAALVQWDPPYDGKVSVEGTLALATPAAANGDGVRLVVFNGNNKVFDKELPAGGAPLPVALASVQVVRDVPLVFALSNKDDMPLVGGTPAEAATFSPAIRYVECTSCTELPTDSRQLVSASGAPLFDFDATRDFRLAGDGTAAVVVPADGTVSLSGTIRKTRRTSDDVRVCVVRFAKGEPVDPYVPCGDEDLDTLRAELAWDFTGEAPGTKTLTVSAGESLLFRVESDLLIDPGAVEWEPAVQMTELCGEGRTGCRVPSESEMKRLAFAADAHRPLHGQLGKSPLLPLVVPRDGELLITSTAGEGAPSDAVYSVRAADRLVLKHHAGDSRTVRLPVAAGDTFLFEAHHEFGAFDPHWSLSVELIESEADGGAKTTVLNPPRYATADLKNRESDARPPFAGGYQGFRYGLWTGPLVAKQDGFDFSLLKPLINLIGYPVFDPPEKRLKWLQEHLRDDADELTRRITRTAPLLPRRRGTELGATPGLYPQPAFVSADGMVFVAAGLMHGGRQGEVTTPDGRSVSTSLAQGKFSALRSSVSSSVGGGLSISIIPGKLGVSLAVGGGSTQQKSDLIDLDGDGVLDVLLANGPGGPGSAYLTDAHTLQPRPQLATPGVRESASLYASLGTGVEKVAFQIDSHGNVTNVEERVATPGLTLSAGLDWARQEMVDVNGDGLPDLVWWALPDLDHPSARMLVKFNLGGRFSEPADELPVGHWKDDGAFEKLTAFIAEQPWLNGGAAPDKEPETAESLVKVGRALDGLRLNEALRRSQTFTLQGNLGTATPFKTVGAALSASTTLSETPVALLDVTGDGLPDYVRKSADEKVFQVRVNTGHGFADAVNWNAPPWFSMGPNGGTGVHAPSHRFPMPDFVNLPTPKPVQDFINTMVGPISKDAVEVTGSHSQYPTVGFIGTVPIPIGPVALHLSFGMSAEIEHSSGFELGFMDVDGDGFADHVLKPHNDPLLGVDDEAVYVRFNQNRRGNLLKRVVRPLGGSFELEFSRTANTVDLPHQRDVLTQVTVHAGVPTVGTGDGYDFTSNFSYEGGRYDRASREFLGFGAVTETSADGVKVVTTYRLDGLEYRGLVDRQQSYDPAGRLILERYHFYGPVQEVLAAVSPGCAARTPFFLAPEVYCGAHFLPEDAVESRRYDWAGGVQAGPLSTRQDFRYDAYGNVKTLTDAGDLGTNLDDFVATIEYLPYAVGTEPYAVGKPTYLLVKGVASGAVLRETRAEYLDGRKNIDRVHARVDEAGRWATSDFTWGKYGELLKATGAENADGQRYYVDYLYDAATHTYPETVTDVFGLTSSTTYDVGLGLARTITDATGSSTRWEYDVFGRLQHVYGPTSDAPVSSIEYPADLRHGPVAATTKNALPADIGQHDDSLDTRVFVDGLGRVVQTQRDASVLLPGSSTRVTGRTVSGAKRYDAMGRVVEEAQLVYAPSGSDYVSSPPTNVTTTAYDALGRIDTVTSPDGAVVRFVYGFGSPNGDGVLRERTEVVDPLGQRRAEYRDAKGRLVAAEEWTGGRALTTRYGVDPMGNVTSVTDANGNLSSYVYDLLGRKTDLHNPDTGRVKFVYDLAGNLIQKQDQRALDAQQPGIRFAYDYGRLIKVIRPTSGEINYTYGMPGAPHFGAGRVVHVDDDAGHEVREYGPLGEVTAIKRHVRALTPDATAADYDISFAYDVYGRLLSMTYPDGETLAYGYDDGGLLLKAVGTRQTATGTETETYLEELAYDAFGNRARARYGNGVVTNYHYDERSRRMDHLRTVAARNRTLQSITYAYYPNGNLQSLVNAMDGSGAKEAVSFNYEYDDLNRLHIVRGESTASGMRDSFYSQFDYDDIHNLKRNLQVRDVTRTGTLDPVHDRPDATNHDWSYVYDTKHGPHQPTRIGNTLLGYDRVGNTTLECDTRDGETCEDNASPGNLRRYAWTDDDHLASVVDGAGQRVTRFVYDHTGERIAKIGERGVSLSIGQFYSVQGKWYATKHIFAGDVRLASKLSPHRTAPQTGTGTSPGGAGNQEGCVPSEYEPQKCEVPADDGASGGSDGTPLQSATYYFHADHVGSTSWMTDQEGEVVEHVEYFPYGAVWNERHEGTRAHTKDAGAFLFSSKPFDEETGLVYFGARYYDPQRARWLSTDPAFFQAATPSAMTLSLYAFASLSPAMFTDPDGLAPVPIGKIYVIRAVEDGVAVIYTGSTSQSLYARFSKHKWRELIARETTSIEVRHVVAEVNVQASRRQTPRAATGEALRSAEQTVKNEVAGEGARVLNEVEAAAGENAATWGKNHSVTLEPKAKATVIKGGIKLGAFAALQLYDAFKYGREQKLAKAGIVENGSPYMFKDEGGTFKFGILESTWWNTTYQKNYIDGPRKGQVIEISDEEFDFYRDTAEALYGYIDWLGDFQPGVLRQSIPVYVVPPPICGPDCA